MIMIQLTGQIQEGFTEKVASESAPERKDGASGIARAKAQARTEAAALREEKGDWQSWNQGV